MRWAELYGEMVATQAAHRYEPDFGYFAAKQQFEPIFGSFIRVMLI
jgi:hypothetical protein